LVTIIVILDITVKFDIIVKNERLADQEAS